MIATISAKELKANSGKILDRIARGEITALTIVKDGEAVGILRPLTDSERSAFFSAKGR